MANKREIVICGVKYKSVNDASKKIGISYSALTNRIKKYGLNDSRILKKPKKTKKPIIIDGIEYESLSEFARKHGLSPQLITDRYRHHKIAEKLGFATKDYLLLEGTERDKIRSEICAYRSQKNISKGNFTISQKGFLTLKDVSKLTDFDEEIIKSVISVSRKGFKSSIFPDLLRYVHTETVSGRRRLFF